MASSPIEPLPLDSPRWRELAHVYGPAEDMPDAVRRLEELDHIHWNRNGPLEDIIAAIYHQGDPDTGSYAVVPHLVRIAEKRPLSERLPLVSLCSWVEQYRTPSRPRIPDDLEPAYRRALIRAREMTIEMLSVPRASWGSHGDPYDLAVIFTTIAALSGDRRVAFLVDHLDEVEFSFKKRCGDTHWPPWPE